VKSTNQPLEAHIIPVATLQIAKPSNNQKPLQKVNQTQNKLKNTSTTP
jgi:hypothetical protein